MPGANETGTPVTERAEKPVVNVDEVAQKARQAEREVVQSIYADCARSEVEVSVADDMVKRGLSADEARKEILDIVAKRQVTPKVSRTEVVEDEGDKLVRDLGSALAHRVNPKNELIESAQRFRHFRMLDMARACVGNPEGLSADEVCRRAFQSTSSFTSLLENTLVKVLRNQFELNVGSFEPFVERTSLPNFQQAKAVKLGDQAGFLELPEHSEFKNANFSDSAEPIQLKTYGQKVSLTRNAIINDDLRAFNRFPLMLARNARYLEADLVYAILVANAALSDGTALFHADHGNLGTGGAISNTTMDEAFKLFRQQTTEGSKFMNVSPRYLIVPPAIEATARRYVSDVVASQTSMP